MVMRLVAAGRSAWRSRAGPAGDAAPARSAAGAGPREAAPERDDSWGEEWRDGPKPPTLPHVRVNTALPPLEGPPRERIEGRTVPTLRALPLRDLHGRHRALHLFAALAPKLSEESLALGVRQSRGHRGLTGDRKLKMNTTHTVPAVEDASRKRRRPLPTAPATNVCSASFPP
jgi:hypothetical protein